MTDKKLTGFALNGNASIAGKKGGMKSKGRKLTEEHKQRLRESHLRRTELVKKALEYENR
jgi:hypothetical protein